MISLALKTNSQLPKKFISFNESPLNMMKNAFSFILKTLFDLNAFKFLSNWLTITIYVLPNISRNKGNQAIKFGQIIKYSKRNIFLQKSCRKSCKETSSRLYLKKQKKLHQSKWSCSLVSIYFCSSQLGHTSTASCTKSRLLIQRYSQF